MKYLLQRNKLYLWWEKLWR